MIARQAYKHSGRFTAAGLSRGMVVGLLVGLALAFIYPYVIVYIPIVGYVSFLISAAFGGLTGIAAGMAMKGAKVRNGGVAALVGLTVSVIAYWLSWAVWVYALLRRADVKDVELLPLVLDPGLLWGAIKEINEVGAWSIKNATPTGTLLWVLWGIEAVIVLGASAAGAASTLDDPFCEACDVWTEEKKGVLTLAGAGEKEIKSKLETEPLMPLLQGIGAPEPGAGQWMTLSLHQCPQCKKLNALSTDLVTKQQKDKTTTTSVVKHLLLAPDEAKDLIALGERLSAAPAAAPAPA